MKDGKKESKMKRISNDHVTNEGDRIGGRTNTKGNFFEKGKGGSILEKKKITGAGMTEIL